MAKKKSKNSSKNSAKKKQTSQPSGKLSRADLKRQQRAQKKEEKRFAERARLNAIKSQRKDVIPVSRLTPDEVSNWKERLQPVVNEANKRIMELNSQGLTSSALEAVHESGRDYFDLTHIYDQDELREEITRARIFLSDFSSRPDVAFMENAMAQAAEYRGQFGNQYSGRRFNINDVLDDEGRLIRTAIDPEIASRAFAAYRRLESESAALIGRQGEAGVYGSENLIIAIYDMEVRGMDGQMYGRDLLDAWERERNFELSNIMSGADDAVAIASSFEDYVHRRFF